KRPWSKVSPRRRIAARGLNLEGFLTANLTSIDTYSIGVTAI
ncbi:3810_t:CDS:2, partial [Diversispora eburnea]